MVQRASKADKMKALADMKAKRAARDERGADDLVAAVGRLNIAAPKPPGTEAVVDLEDSGSEDEDSESEDDCIEPLPSPCKTIEQAAVPPVPERPARTLPAPAADVGAEPTEASSSNSCGSEERPGGDAEEVPPTFVLRHCSKELAVEQSLYERLYEHQVEALQWMWRVWCMERGGILADDMGLGKTLTSTSFLAAMIAAKRIRRALVVAPKTLLLHWAEELKVVGLQRRTHEYFGSASAREAELRRVQRGRGVLLTTYGMVLHNAEALAKRPRETTFEDDDDPDVPYWDVIFLDEGHKIKNPGTQIYKALQSLPCRMRVVISGTPIQNNLLELHALFDFCCPDLLGDRRAFMASYARPIEHSQDKLASQRAVREGAGLASAVRDTISPFFLRREKKSTVMRKVAALGSRGCEGSPGEEQLPQATVDFPRKNDFIVWLRFQPIQRKLYEAFLLSGQVKAALNQTGSALAAITVLKKLCDHPALLSDRAAELAVKAAGRFANRARLRRQHAGDSSDDGVDDDEDDDEDYVSDSDDEPEGVEVDASAFEDWSDDGAASRLLESLHQKAASSSCKTVFVMALLRNLAANGHRTLVFSQSRVMLDILQAELTGRGTRFERIDGSVASPQQRQAIVQNFQRDASIPVFLLSSQVGGLGLTITAADRIVIVDPAWNPATDNQSVDRAYRIGQRRHVVVYRLITCGTVEEKIYRNQVFKGALAKLGMEETNPTRYFSRQELRDLFACNAAELQASDTQKQLQEMHGESRVYSPDVQAHLDDVLGLPFVASTSDHMLLFERDEAMPPGGPLSAAELVRPHMADSTSAQTPFVPPRRAPRPQQPPAAWSGPSSISDLLKLAAADLGRGKPKAGAPKNAPDATNTLLREHIAKLERTLHSTGASLPDAGVRLTAMIAQKREELAALEQSAAQVLSLTDASSAGAANTAQATPAGASTGVDELSALMQGARLDPRATGDAQSDSQSAKAARQVTAPSSDVRQKAAPPGGKSAATQQPVQARPPGRAGSTGDASKQASDGIERCRADLPATAPQTRPNAASGKPPNAAAMPAPTTAAGGVWRSKSIVSDADSEESFESAVSDEGRAPPAVGQRSRGARDAENCGAAGNQLAAAAAVPPVQNPTQAVKPAPRLALTSTLAVPPTSTSALQARTASAAAPAAPKSGGRNDGQTHLAAGASAPIAGSGGGGHRTFARISGMSASEVESERLAVREQLFTLKAQIPKGSAGSEAQRQYRLLFARYTQLKAAGQGQ